MTIIKIIKKYTTCYGGLNLWEFVGYNGDYDTYNGLDYGEIN